MAGHAQPIRAVILAGDREGGSALARTHGLAAGVLVPVAHRTCIEHVVEALRTSAAVRGGVIVGPAGAIARTNADMQRVLAGGDFTWIEPATGPSASALLGTATVDRYPVLVTAGDHALLDGAIVDAFCAAAARSRADFVVGLVPHAIVRAAFPESRRTILRFRDGAFCGSNLFLLGTSHGRRAFEFWQALETDRKHPWRIALSLGPMLVARYLARTLTVGRTFEILSERAGCAIDYCVVEAARAAVDVDSGEDLKLAERLLTHG